MHTFAGRALRKIPRRTCEGFGGASCASLDRTDANIVSPIQQSRVTQDTAWLLLSMFVPRRLSGMNSTKACAWVSIACAMTVTKD